MAGGIDEIELVVITIIRGVVKGHALRLDRNTALALDVHGVEHLFGHFAIAQATANLDEAISQRGFAVVYVRNNGKVTDQIQAAHRGRSCLIFNRGAIVPDSPDTRYGTPGNG